MLGAYMRAFSVGCIHACFYIPDADLLAVFGLRDGLVPREMYCDGLERFVC